MATEQDLLIPKIIILGGSALLLLVVAYNVASWIRVRTPKVRQYAQNAAETDHIKIPIPRFLSLYFFTCLSVAVVASAVAYREHLRAEEFQQQVKDLEFKLLWEKINTGRYRERFGELK